MQIEAGKYYRTRNGRKVGPMVHTDNKGAKFYCKDIGLYFCDGTFGYGEYVRCKDFDLIEECQDEPATKIDKLEFNVEYTSDEPDYAALAAQHRIKITVQVGEMIVEYDGRG